MGGVELKLTEKDSVYKILMKPIKASSKIVNDLWGGSEHIE